MKKKINLLIITHNAERHYYFCNYLIENLDCNIKVILGAKKNRYQFTKIEKILIKLKKNFYKNVYNFFINKIFFYFGKKFYNEKYIIENEFFYGCKEKFIKNYEQLVLADISKSKGYLNDNKYIEIIKEGKFDVIAVMGSVLVNSKIINSSSLILNLHTGLSPYYRGGNTNCWPIIKNEYGAFGATIHKMSQGIDNGDIFSTKRILVEKKDSYSKINCRSIISGSKLMVDAINKYSRNEINFLKQWCFGKLFYNSDWNNYFAFKYYINLKKYINNHYIKQKEEFIKLKLVYNGKIL